MGSEWWDVKRKEAYAKNNYHCWACGSGDHTLEAHEAYHIIYSHGKSFFVGVVALCPDCHKFIHCGRLVYRLRGRKVSKREYKRIMLRGYQLLRKADLRPCYSFRASLLRALPMYPIKEREWIRRCLVKTKRRRQSKVGWSDWRLVFNGKEYPPLKSKG